MNSKHNQNLDALPNQLVAATLGQRTDLPALPADFWRSPAYVVAPALIGKKLCCHMQSKRNQTQLMQLTIVETEAYVGTQDPACLMHLKRRKHAQAMLGAGGLSYIYATYGIHHMVNIVTGDLDSPESVLIRAGVLENQQDFKSCAGPGKLSKTLGLTRAHSGVALGFDSGLWVADTPHRPTVVLRPRIGIDYAGIGKDWQLRYLWHDHKSVSKP